MKYKLLAIAPFFLLMGLMISCTTDEIKEELKVDYSQDFIEDDIVLEDLMEDLFIEIEESNYWLYGFKDGRTDEDCRTITVDPEERDVFPKTITIDYGEGCEIREGLVKRGRIVIEMSAAPNSDEWEKTIRFERYSVNDKRFEGGKNISFKKEGRRDLPTWEIGSRIKIHWDEESFVQQSMVRTRVQTVGFFTPRRPMDDQFIVSGTTTGVNRKGKGYKTTITEPLHSSRDCRWIKKGVIVLNVRGESEAVLDYGDGTCDNIATITRDGEVKEIKLKGFPRN